MALRLLAVLFLFLAPVTALVSVRRGWDVDIRRDLPHSLPHHCEVHVATTPAVACGAVTPSSFECSYNGSLRYQHFGCLAQRESVLFQLSALLDGERRIEFFSVEVAVEDSASPYSGLTLRTSDGPSLRVVFPARTVGRCQYEILSQHPFLPLPLAGQLSGEVNRPLPCGLSTQTALRYAPLVPSERDYAWIRVRTRTGQTVYTVATLSLSDHDQADPHPLDLPAVSLLIPQATRTPVNLSLNLPPEHQYKITFPVHPAGTFLLVHGSASTTHTLFTLADLQAGLVSFQPSEQEGSSSTTFYYTVANLAGTTVARGAVVTHSPPRDWSLPSQRTNQGLQVLQGLSAHINSSILDFYTLGVCQVRLTRRPSHGQLLLPGGGDECSLPALRNGSLLYNHSGDSLLVDGAHWELQCASYRLLVFMSIHIAPVTALPFLADTNLIASPDFASPLSSSSLMLPSTQTIQVHVANGHVVRVQQNAVSSGPLFPLVPTSVLVAHGTPVANASVADIEQQLIWYIPPLHATSDSLSLSTEAGSRLQFITVTLVSQDISKSHCLSAAEGHIPRLLHNLPLPIHQSLPLYITPAFLSAEVAPFSTDSVVFEVLTDPAFGKLCHLHKDCRFSLPRFSQTDISLQNIVYVPVSSTTLRNDTFYVTLQAEGLQDCYHPVYHFDIVTHLERATPETTKQFWVNKGGAKRIGAKYFRHFVKWFNSRDLIFHISSPAQYGAVLLNNTVCEQFSFSDTLQGWVWFHHYPTTVQHCSDTISFTVQAGSDSLNDSLLIIVKQSRESKVAVHTTPHTLEGQSTFVFSSKDVGVSSSFCPQFVYFTLEQRPKLGALSLYQPSLGTVVQLRESGSFTAEDIIRGYLQYTLTQPQVNASDSFNFSITYPSSLTSIDALPSRQPTPPPTYEVLITTPTPGVVHIVSVAFNTPRPMSWLAQEGSYGYFLTASDIRVQSDSVDLHPSQVRVIISEQPKWGNVLLNNSIKSEFSLEDVYQGWVWYRAPPNVHNYDISSEVFLVSMVVFLDMHSVRVHPVYRQPFSIEWSTVELSKKAFVVHETDKEVIITLRRDGPVWFPCQVTLTTHSVSAMATTSCNTSLSGDYCLTTVLVTFAPNQTDAAVSVSIVDDRAVEGPESFRVELSDPINTTIHSSSATVTVLDPEDYAVIAFQAPTADPNSFYCQKEVRVREGVGTLELNLSREGNLEQEVGVICYTKAALRGDFIPRPNTADSMVTFAPYQRHAVCNVEVVDDMRNEGRELFQVLLGATKGLVQVDEQSSAVCVFISHDPSDAPEVLFNTSEVRVRESESQEVHANFIILRKGPDLSFTTTVSFRAFSLSTDTATPGLDYSTFSSGNCGVGEECVTFQANQTTILRTVYVLPDRLREGRENLHVNITDVLGGRRGNPGLLQIVIEDGTSSSVVAFNSTEFHFSETGGAVFIPIYRSGSVSESITVRCILKQESMTQSNHPAISYTSIMKTTDFLVPESPERAKIASGNTTAACSVYLVNDTRWEGPESFIVRLDSNEDGVLIPPEASLARVFIHDPEDEPLVQFSQDSFNVLEPLSSYPPDEVNASILLIRSGDLQLSSTVSYTTVNGTAEAYIDYWPASGQVTFEPGQRTAEIAVRVLSNRHKHTSLSLSVVLSLDLSLFPGVMLGSQWNTTLLIRNTPEQGAVLPGLPAVSALLPNGSLVPGSSQPWDLPLICLSPCDDLHSSEWAVLECERQHINPALTEYSWEVSVDGALYQPLSLETAIVSPRHKVLESVYLSPGLVVRCKAQAVNSTFSKGPSRDSLPVHLSCHHSSQCSTGSAPTVQAQLSTYQGFRGAPEDLVRLEVSVSYVNNSIPLLSTLPEEGLNNTHSCSTLTTDNNSLLKPLPSSSSSSSFSPSSVIYQHLNRNSCLWHYSVWYPLQVLQEECGGELGRNSFNLSLFAAHIHFNHTWVVSAQLPPSLLHLPLPSNPPPTVPFLILPTDTLSVEVVLLPVTLEFNSSSSQLTAYLYTLSQQPLSAAQAVSLYSTNSSAGYRQAWRLTTVISTADQDSLLVAFSLCPSWPTCSTAYFILPFSLQPSPSITPALHAALVPSTDTEVDSVQTFAYGDKVYVEVTLNSSQQLLPGYRLEIQQVLACTANHSDPQENCDGAAIRLTILDPASGKISSEFGAGSAPPVSPDRAVIYFLTTPLYAAPTDAGQQWLVYVTFAVAGREEHTEHSAALPLLIQPHTPPVSNGGLSSPFFYATIAILSSAFLLVLAGLAVSTLLCWSWRAHHRSLLRLQRGQEEANNSKCQPLPQAQALSTGLRRASSTTGIEKTATSLHKATSPASQTTVSTASGLHHSKSLPNLSPVQRLPTKQRRRNLAKPLTTVKMARRKHTALSPVRIIQNDLGSSTVRPVELASYAMLSLAASAHTPEPGSMPATEL